MTIEEIKLALAKVTDSESKKDIISAGLVHNIFVEKDYTSFELKLGNPAMHYRKGMEEACRFALKRHFGKEISCEIKVTATEKIAKGKGMIPGVKNIIAVASGKGGVGKSTITANLAVGLAQRGFKVGLVDADIYGPSMPLMFGVMNEKPQPIEVEGRKLIDPVVAFGVKILSIGFFASADQAIVWRGPMASKALNQLFSDAHWGELDYLLVDLPPGTGDIHLTLVQSIPLTGAVIVTTPQPIALADARKGVAMFKLETIKVPIVGLVENMAWFTPDELPENKYYIFGKEGGKQLAKELGIPLIGNIPLVQSLRESGDAGRPAILQESGVVRSALEDLIDNFTEQVGWRNENLPETKMVDVNMVYPK